MKIEIELPDGFIAEIKQSKSKVTIKIVATEGTSKKVGSPLVQIKSKKISPTIGKTQGYKIASAAGRGLNRPPAKKAAASKKSTTLSGTTSTGPKKPNVKY